jgi:hypothetical protein
MPHFKKRHIIKLGEEFGFNGFRVWESMKSKQMVIIGKRFLFIKYNHFLDAGLSCFDDDYDYTIIKTLTVELGDKSTYNYQFFESCGDYEDAFIVSIKGITKMHEFLLNNFKSEKPDRFF